MGFRRAQDHQPARGQPIYFQELSPRLRCLSLQSPFPVMSEPSPAKSGCKYIAAFSLLRLFLGLRTFFAGVEKFEAKGTYSLQNYSDNMTRMAQGITGASF